MTTSAERMRLKRLRDADRQIAELEERFADQPDPRLEHQLRRLDDLQEARRAGRYRSTGKRGQPSTSTERMRRYRERRSSERTCVNCGERFLTLIPDRDCCSALCRLPLTQVGYLNCVICKKLFVTREARERKTCGQPECQRDYLHMRTRNRQHLKRSSVSDITPEQEDAVRRRARNCPLCGVKLTNKAGLPNSKHLDHILPICMGGTHTWGNTRILCRTCNLSRPKDGSDFTGQLTLWAQGPAPVSRPDRRREGGANANKETCRKGLHPWTPANIMTAGNGKKLCKPCRQASERARGQVLLRQCKCGALFPAPGRTFMCPACVETTARHAAELHASGLAWDQVAAEVGYESGTGAWFAAKRIGYAPAPKPAKPVPLCPGCGTPKRPGKCEACTATRAWRAVEMRQAGMTLEEIGTVLGYTSKTTVTNLMKTVVAVEPYSRNVTLSDGQAVLQTMSRT